MEANHPASKNTRPLLSMPIPFTSTAENICDNNDIAMLSNGELGTPSSGPLPLELMVLIFGYAIPSAEERGSVDPRRFSPFALAHVCRSWRSITLGAPQLWADVATSSFGADLVTARKVLAFWLEKAADAPTSISHTPDFGNWLALRLDNNVYEQYRQETDSFIEEAVKCPSQNQSLSLKVFKSRQLDRVLDPLREHRPDVSVPRDQVEAKFPLLEELELASMSTDAGSMRAEASIDGDDVFTSIDIACPRLSHLKLGFADHSTIPGPKVLRMRTMRSLDLEQCASLQPCLRWIDVCPDLRKLTVKLSCKEQDLDFVEEDEMDEEERSHLQDIDVEGLVAELTGNAVSPVAPITFFRRPRRLPDLTTLDIQGACSPENVARLLGVLVTPSLRELKLSSFTGGASGSTELSPLRSFLLQCSPKLESLDVNESGMAADELHECLALLPDLRVLRLGRLEDAGELLKHLTVSDKPSLPAMNQLRRMPSTLKVRPEILCPNLDAIYLPHTRIPFDNFVDMAHSRSGKEGGCCQALKVVGVDIKTARKAGRDEKLAALMARGLVVEEVENDMIMAI